jgi:hypothetical protein
MIRMSRKLCTIDASTEVKQDILDCGDEVRRQVGEFLESLQWDPLPKGRQPRGEGAFGIQLRCGIFVAWEIIGDLLHLALKGPDETILVRILGVGWGHSK